MNWRNRNVLMLVLFFGSGSTALVYEVVWSKFLSQMFGSTIYAQTVVLAVFMGGLALGNNLLGHRADRLRQPLRIYGCLEIFIGLYAFLFPTLDQFADAAFVAVGSHIAEKPLLLLFWKGLLSVLLLLGPTILMGGTLPLIGAWLQKFSGDAGRRSAWFYSINSLGAVAGAGLAGFWLIQNVGLVCTLQITGLANVIIGVTAAWISQSQNQIFPREDQRPTEVSGEPTAGLNWRLSCMVVGLTGAVSMALEVLASRSLAMIFGSSLQSFAVVLMAFILGIGLGSAWIASARRKIPDQKMIVLLLCLAAAWITLLVFNLERWVDFYRLARAGIASSSVGYFYQEVLTISMALAVIGVPAAAIGAVLPLMIRAAAGNDLHLGGRIGALLTTNTLGAVGGTLVAGFVLMPLIGLRNAYGVLALVLAMAAWLLALHSRWRGGCGIAAIAAGFCICLLIFGGESWRWVMSSGVFRAHELEFDPTAMSQRKQHIKILFYEDAADATVSVEDSDGAFATKDRSLRVNGKPDASTEGDMNTQMLLAHLPMLSRPEGKDVFVFGLGSGVSAGALRSYPGITNIVIAENCEPVVRAVKFFREENRDVLHDPRTKLWHEDARTVLKLSPQNYDAIVSEPSNPWTAGIGSVFSLEFYKLCAARLKPGGIMVQWFHLYEMHDGIAELVLRTFTSVFPNVEIWDSCYGDIILLGSQQPWISSPETFAKNFAVPGVRADLDRLGVNSPEALFARQLASQRTAFAIPGPGPIQSDLFPVLEYAAPFAFFLGKNSSLLEKFDERTRQQLLASTEKTSRLRSLQPETVQAVFSRFGSANTELLSIIRHQPGSENLPCALNPSAPRVPQMPALGLNKFALSNSLALLANTPDRAAEGIAQIELILNTLPTGTNSDAAKWATLTAAAALGMGDAPTAARLSSIALKFNPDDAIAPYLQRILARANALTLQK